MLDEHVVFTLKAASDNINTSVDSTQRASGKKNLYLWNNAYRKVHCNFNCNVLMLVLPRHSENTADISLI